LCEQHAPEALRVVGIVGFVRGVGIEAHGVRYFAGHRVDDDGDAELAQRDHHVVVELRHADRPQHHLAEFAVALADPQRVVEKIEIDLEAAAAIGNGRRGQSAHRDVERDVPGMVLPGRQREPDLADDLRHQMQRRARIAPGARGQRGPSLVGGHGGLPLTERL
jgi:hypothetical protein